MNYKCLPKNKYELENYSIVSLREQDIFKIKDWRNSQLEVLRQKELLTDKGQENYYNTIVKPTYFQEYPKQILFSFLQNNICIGYGGLVHISWEDKRAEISFLVDNIRAKNRNLYQKDFSIYLELIKHLAFKDLDMRRLYLETYDIRDFHIQIIETSGFKLEGRLRQHVIINNKEVDSLVHALIKQEYYEGEKDIY